MLGYECVLGVSVFGILQYVLERECLWRYRVFVDVEGCVEEGVCCALECVWGRECVWFSRVCFWQHGVLGREFVLGPECMY